MIKISAVINTFNEERIIARAIKSLFWVDEVIVCDMHSSDRTVQIAKKLGAKLYFHRKEDFVELVRNFAVDKTSNEWILVLDPDEEIPQTLGKRLKESAEKLTQISFIRIPRKNIIFGRWITHSGWWPDYNIRFFRKGKVKWMDKIHRPPLTEGAGIDLPADEKFAIIHYSYKELSEFLNSMDRYTTIQVKELLKGGYRFDWKDLLEKPLDEFLLRLFANEGFKDGLHGLSLSLLQAFSFMIVYLKLWEENKFINGDIDLKELDYQKKKLGMTLDYWMKKNYKGNIFQKILKKVKYI